MGFGQSTNAQYLNVSSGVLKYKNKAGETITGGYYDGRIVSIARRTDTYEGNEIEKVLVTMEDHTDGGKEMPRAIIQFTLESWYAVTFFSRLGAVLDKPRVRVGAYGSKNNEKVSFAYVQYWDEAGERVKVQADPDFPEPVKQKVGNKEVADYTRVIEAAEKLIAQVNGSRSNDQAEPPPPTLIPPPSRSKPAPAARQAKAAPAANNEEDLPF